MEYFVKFSILVLCKNKCFVEFIAIVVCSFVKNVLSDGETCAYFKVHYILEKVVLRQKVLKHFI